MKMKRPSCKATNSRPGTEPVAEAAAALAAASILFKADNAGYSNKLLTHAKQLYNFGKNKQGNYGSICNAQKFYRYTRVLISNKNYQQIRFSFTSSRSWSGFKDELSWAAGWLHKATRQNSYLQDAKRFYREAGNNAGSQFSWDEKKAGAAVLLMEANAGNEYKNHVKSYCNNFRGKANNQGVACYTEWGNNRYAANSAYICIRASFGSKEFEHSLYHDK